MFFSCEDFYKYCNCNGCCHYCKLHKISYYLFSGAFNYDCCPKKVQLTSTYILE